MRYAVDAHAIGRHLTGNEVYIRSLLGAFTDLDRDSQFIAYVCEQDAENWLPGRVRVHRVARNPWARLGWDLARRVILAHCRGSSSGVQSVSFSSDGVTLASAGRMEAKVWDAATGRLLLNLIPRPTDRNHMTQVAFSPDGSRLAVGSFTAHGLGGGFGPNLTLLM